MFGCSWVTFFKKISSGFLTVSTMCEFHGQRQTDNFEENPPPGVSNQWGTHAREGKAALFGSK
jgi:hypothetical protein